MKTWQQTAFVLSAREGIIRKRDGEGGIHVPLFYYEELQKKEEERKLEGKKFNFRRRGDFSEKD